MQDTTILILDAFGNDYAGCYKSIRGLYPGIKIIAINPSDLQAVKDNLLQTVVIHGDFATRKAEAVHLIDTPYSVVMDGCSCVNAESNIELLVDRVREDYDVCGGQISFDGRVEFLYGAIHIDESLKILKGAGTDLVHFFYAIKSDVLKSYKPNSGFYFFEDHLDDCVSWKKAHLKVGFESRCILFHREIDKNLLRYNFRPMFRAFEAKHHTKYAPVLPSISANPLISKKSPRVGFIATSYISVGGTEIFHRSLLPRLKDFVNLVGFVSTDAHGGDGTRLEVPYSIGFGAAKQLAAQCDIVVVWGIDKLSKILPARKSPKVLAVHHSDWASVWNNRTILDQLDVIDSIVSVSQDASEKLALCGKPSHYIPNAIVPERIIPSGKQGELRGKFGIPVDSKIVLFGHRLTEEKRPELAIDISRILPTDWTMVMVGTGYMQDAIKKYAVGCDRVRIVGECESLADWFSISDCFISLSKFEGFGLAIAEAIAAGIPVVSTPTGIAPGLANILPTDSTPSQWVEAIIKAKIIVTPELILDKFNMKKMVDSWVRVLKQM